MTLSLHLKKILVFNSSLIEVGIVGKLLSNFNLISADFSFSLALSGSYFKQKSKFVFVYSCPQYTLVSGGRILSLFNELSMSSWVPSKTLPQPKENKVLESIKDEFNLSEGPAYEYKKHSKKIEKSLKDLQKNYLDFYEVLRKKGLNDEASDFLDNYKKNVVGFTKKYKKDFGKLM